MPNLTPYIFAIALLGLAFYIGSLTHVSMTCKADITFNQDNATIKLMDSLPEVLPALKKGK